jgi:hypothetical protein
LAESLEALPSDAEDSPPPNRNVRVARATVEYSRTQSAPRALSQRPRTKIGDGQCQIDDMAGKNKDKHQEGNLGQKDARLQKEKQSELSNLGESSRENRKDD